MNDSQFAIEVVVSAPLGENTYLIWDRRRPDQAAVVDPGFATRKTAASIARHQLSIATIVCTHGHFDHIAGNADMKRSYPEAPIWIGRNEADFLTDPMKNLSLLSGQSIVSPAADRLLDDGETISFGGRDWLVREIPGHSPGHVVFIDQSDSKIVIGGDVLFAGSIGRTDFPGGDFNQLAAGIRAKLYVLDGDAVVYPGHGEPTTIGEERRSNPFVREID